MPPLPKAPELRRRTNRTSTAATLAADGGLRRAPPLPKGREWRAETRGWWASTWRSPMAAEYLEADRHGLLRLAVVIDLFWAEPSVYLLAEIRQQEARYGLSPLDRRRLQWQVEPADAAQQPSAPQPPRDATDARRMLSVV